MVWELAAGVCVAAVAVWIVLVVVLVVARPAGFTGTDLLRVLPDVVRLLRRLAGDRTLRRPVRARIYLLLAYLVFPLDFVPDFVPVIGYADDAIITCLVLRSVVRRAGGEAVRRHWPGTDTGLDVVWKLAGLDRVDREGR